MPFPLVRLFRWIRPGRTRPGSARSRRLVTTPALEGLEGRVVPSAIAARIARSTRVVERANIPFPTPAGPAESLNVYMPASPAPVGGRPVIVAIHGGGWRRLNKNGYGDRVASAFVPNGYVVVAPNYRLSHRGSPSWPANFNDVQAAVAWVRSNAAALGINPQEIAAMGESAGGNLAELLGTASAASPPGLPSSRVNAVIAFSAPSDLSALYARSRLAGLAAAQFLGGKPSQVPSLYAAASPIDHVAPVDPPMYLVHGRQDPLVPVAQSKAMAAALAAAGVPHHLTIVSGGHDLNFPVHFGDLTRRLLEFLSSTWEYDANLSGSH